MSSLVPALGIFETIAALGIVTTLYTCYGGMHAVVWTDFVQTLALATVLGALFWKGLSGLRREGGMELGVTDILQLNWGM